MFLRELNSRFHGEKDIQALELHFYGKSFIRHQVQTSFPLFEILDPIYDQSTNIS